jgi:hypothetical protein
MKGSKDFGVEKVDQLRGAVSEGSNRAIAATHLFEQEH